jgi:DNA-binding Lrp family transcriptional regulator
LLQHDARNNTTKEIGERIGVSDSTVSNRIAALEERGVVRGYTVLLDYEKAGVNPKLLLVCTAPANERDELAREAIDTENVVDVRKVLGGERNVHVTAVGRTVSELSATTTAIEELGLTIVDSGLVNGEYHNPFDDFGTDTVDSS